MSAARSPTCCCLNLQPALSGVTRRRQRHDSSEGILNGVEAICAKAKIMPADVEIFLHGTTVATNAVLEGKGARVGLVVTEGYRQVRSPQNSVPSRCIRTKRPPYSLRVVLMSLSKLSARRLCCAPPMPRPGAAAASLR